MPTPSRLVPVALLLLGALTTAFPAGAEAPPALAGTWRLVEQYYGTGQRNFVDEGEPYRLTLQVDGGRVTGTAALAAQTAAWPAYFGPDGPRPLQGVTVVPDSDGLGVRAAFRVVPGAGDDTWLVVTETLRVGLDGRLAATLTVEFERMGERNGAFTWRRVFVREDGP